MIREATCDDAEKIAAFLQHHVETSMFLLSNLEQHGIIASDHAHATRYFIYEQGASVQGVFGCTRNGYLMCQHPGLCLSTARDYLSCIEGTRVQGMTGVTDQVALFVEALRALDDAWLLNRVEPLFGLELAKLKAPDSHLCAPKQGDRAMLEAWFERLLIETGIADAAHAPASAVLRAAAAITGTNTRIYLDDAQTPVGMTSVNARAGKAVQIGGVFVLPEHRGQGHAGRMVAAHLAQLRECGIKKAILFAASDSAAKAYTRVGFQRLGGYRVAMLREPCVMGDAAWA